MSEHHRGKRRATSSWYAARPLRGPTAGTQSAAGVSRTAAESLGEAMLRACRASPHKTHGPGAGHVLHTGAGGHGALSTQRRRTRTQTVSRVQAHVYLGAARGARAWRHGRAGGLVPPQVAKA